MKETIEAFEQIYAIKPPKQLAAETGTNHWLLYKWAHTGENHRTNPVEHVAALTTATGNLALVDCICQMAGGVFVPNPPVRGPVSADFSKARGALMLHLGEFVAAVARAVLTGRVSPSHARGVRQCWNQLKSVGEGFVRACEGGLFSPSPRRAPVDGKCF